MKKKKLFLNDSKYDYFRKITNDGMGKIRGGEAGTTNLALPNNPPSNANSYSPGICNPTDPTIKGGPSVQGVFYIR